MNGEYEEIASPWVVADGWFTFEDTTSMLILWVFDRVGGPGGMIFGSRPRRKKRAQPGPCFMAKSQILYRLFWPNSANNIGFCIALGIMGGGVCDFNHDLDRGEKEK